MIQEENVWALAPTQALQGPQVPRICITKRKKQINSVPNWSQNPSTQLLFPMYLGYSII